jgi:flagellar FliL protein
VNPAGTEGTRFLLISIAIDPRRPLSVDALAADDVRLRDALIRVLGGKSVEALVDVATRDTLVEELRLAIEVITGTGTIERVFLPQYVIQ